MTGRTSAFERNVEQIAEEAGAMARAWSTESRLARDEAMGAELLTTREFVEQVGILFESAERLNDLAVRQAGHLLRDCATTLRRAIGEPGLHNCRDLAISHWQQRILHIAEGADEFHDLLRSETRKATDAMFGLWRPFAAVVGRDWRDLGRGPDQP